MKLGVGLMAALVGYAGLYYGYHFAEKAVPLTFPMVLFPWRISDLQQALATAQAYGNQGATTVTPPEMKNPPGSPQHNIYPGPSGKAS